MFGWYCFLDVGEVHFIAPNLMGYFRIKSSVFLSFFLLLITACGPSASHSIGLKDVDAAGDALNLFVADTNKIGGLSDVDVISSKNDLEF